VDVFGVIDGVGEAGDELFRVNRQEGDWQSVDCELDFVGASQNGNQGAFPTVNGRLSGDMRPSKYATKAPVGLVVSVMRRVIEPRSLTLVVTTRGRVQFASRRTRAAMSGRVAAIMWAWLC